MTGLKNQGDIFVILPNCLKINLFYERTKQHYTYVLLNSRFVRDMAVNFTEKSIVYGYIQGNLSQFMSHPAVCVR